jgi:glutamine phosphoribosylpyrophosphate amidotransferase
MKGDIMCGIFAYSGTGPPDPDLLWAAADGAAQRGPHGYGWVTSNGGGDLTIQHRLGALEADSGALTTITATRVLGHARLGTASGGDDPFALQPVVADGHALAHNGHVYNARELDFEARTDSTALARVYNRLRKNTRPVQALADLARMADQRAWAIVVLDSTGGLYAHRHYHPLFWWRADDGVYVSSQHRHPDAAPVPEDRPVAVEELRS